MWAAATLLLAGCPGERGVDGRGGTNGAAPADAVTVDGAADTADASDGAVCLAGDPFVASGSLQVRDAQPGDAQPGDAQPGDARRVEALRWASYDGCERVVIDLGTEDGAAAERAGVVTAEVLRELGVVRLSLREVEYVDPAATDAGFDGPLATDAFSTWSPDGRWVSVDVHMGDAAEAYVATVDDPARVVVDLRPGGPQVPGPAPRAGRVVVLAPRPGTASYPLTVTGYARTFEANVVVRLEHDGENVYDDFTTATAWVDAWGHYSFTIERGPRGRVVLHVGEHSARDGTWEGVAVELEMR
jgi:hypothetical protein